MQKTISFQFTVEELQDLIKKAVADALPKPPVRLYNTTDAAKYLGVSTVTLHTWKNKGKVEAKRVGSNLRFEQPELDRLIKEVPRLNRV